MTQKYFGSRHCLSQVGSTAVGAGAWMGKSAVLVVYKVVMGGLESDRTRNVTNASSRGVRRRWGGKG